MWEAIRITAFVEEITHDFQGVMIQTVSKPKYSYMTLQENKVW